MNGSMRPGRLPRLLFVGAALAAFFLAGMYAEHAEIMPLSVESVQRTLNANLSHWDLRRSANLTWVPGPRRRECGVVPSAGQALLEARLASPRLHCPAAEVAPADAAGSRVEFLAGRQLVDRVLFKGEVGAFLDLDQCPAPWGCLAVEYSRAGAVRRSWPLLPESIAEASVEPESRCRYSHPIGWSFERAVAQSGRYHIAPYPDGDLLVVFQFALSNPYAGGVARVAPDGRARWYRKDCSHHWPHVVDGDLALVPGLRNHRRSVPYLLADGRRWVLRCSDRSIREDVVRFLDREGGGLREISILDAILESPWASMLSAGVPPCNPTHVNFVHLLGEDAAGAPGIAPGDLVVSIRNLNAFGILEKGSGRLKRLVRGSFHQQHGVQHLEKARFILFDNLGAGLATGPSRLLVVDLATGQERTVFPTSATPERLRFLLRQEGQFDVSPDRQRVLVGDRYAGRALEFRIADGEILNAFHHVHDMSSHPSFPTELRRSAWLFEFRGIHYAKGP